MSNKYDPYYGKKRRIVEAMTSVYKEEHRHLCASCKCAFYLLLRDKEDITDWFYQKSTQDPHFCDLYEKTYNDESIVCATDESGNTRVYLDGYKTVDNGSGYWVIDCPYYEELF